MGKGGSVQYLSQEPKRWEDFLIIAVFQQRRAEVRLTFALLIHTLPIHIFVLEVRKSVFLLVSINN